MKDILFKTVIKLYSSKFLSQFLTARSLKSISSQKVLIWTFSFLFWGVIPYLKNAPISTLRWIISSTKPNFFPTPIRLVVSYHQIYTSQKLYFSTRFQRYCFKNYNYKNLNTLLKKKNQTTTITSINKTCQWFKSLWLLINFSSLLHSIQTLLLNQTSPIKKCVIVTIIKVFIFPVLGFSFPRY